MKKLVIALVALSLGSAAQAQKKYEKMVYKPVSQETGDITVMAKDFVTNDAMAKFSLKILNKTDMMLLYKPKESAFLIAGREEKPNEKMMIIPQGDADSKVMNLKGQDLRVQNYSFRVDGVYKFSDREPAVEAPEFQLPPSTNDFKAGNFTCTMLSLQKETDKTSVKFDCMYSGDKIGVINPGRAAVKLPDGTEIANAKSKSKSEVLLKGESTKITLSWNRMEGGKATDMQRIKMQILWRNTFVESDPQKLPAVEIQAELDPAQSK